MNTLLYMALWLGGLIAIMIAGLIWLRKQTQLQLRKLDFIEQYEENVEKLLTSKDRNYAIEGYVFLTENADRMDKLMDYCAVVFTPRYGELSIPVHIVYEICNAVIKNQYDYHFEENVLMVDVALNRTKAMCEDYQKTIEASLKNPLKWLLAGCRVILYTPVYVLKSIGLISEKMALAIFYGKVFTLISGLSSLASVVVPILELLQTTS